MTAAPQWGPSGEQDLLALVASGPMSGHADREWATFVEALTRIGHHSRDGRIDPNIFRGFVRGEVAPRRIGAFTNRALAQGLVEYTGRWVVSDDTQGRNAGKPCRELRWIGGEL